MWTRNSDVSNWNMLKHFIYSSSSKSTTSFLCSTYYRYSSKLFSFFCILSFLVRATSIDQTFYSATHYLAAVWLDSRHDFNNKWEAWSSCKSWTKMCRIILFNQDYTACSTVVITKYWSAKQLNEQKYQVICMYRFILMCIEYC